MIKNKAKYTVDSPEVIARCGPKPIASFGSMVCPHCGTPEVFCNSDDPSDTNKWFWAIRAFEVDEWSKCLSCDEWFAS